MARHTGEPRAHGSGQILRVCKQTRVGRVLRENVPETGDDSSPHTTVIPIYHVAGMSLLLSVAA